MYGCAFMSHFNILICTASGCSQPLSLLGDCALEAATIWVASFQPPLMGPPIPQKVTPLPCKEGGHAPPRPRMAAAPNQVHEWVGVAASFFEKRVASANGWPLGVYNQVHPVRSIQHSLPLLLSSTLTSISFLTLLIFVNLKQVWVLFRLSALWFLVSILWGSGSTFNSGHLDRLLALWHFFGI